MESTPLRPHRPTTPGRIIAMEMEERGWTQSDVSHIIGRPMSTVSELISGSARVTPEIAQALGAAFGTSAELWANLETNYRLAQAASEDSQAAIRLGSELYTRFPVRDMVRLGWIGASKEAAGLENNLRAFFNEPDLANVIPLKICCRMSAKASPNMDWLCAWKRRAEIVCERQSVEDFDVKALQYLVEPLIRESCVPNSVAKVESELRTVGVHFAIVPHLPKTKLDGATFVAPDGRPAVVLTMRYGRLDHFWFTLAHELAHIALGHQEQGSFDVMDELEDEDSERSADARASEWLVPADAYEAFKNRFGMRPRRELIEGFAGSIHRHPGIVIGRMQHDHMLQYSSHRDLLPDIRKLVQPTGQ